MIQVTRNGDISTIKMARGVFGRPLYFTACYFVDGLLVDTGCVACRDEFSNVMRDLPVHSIVNTHSHEDHIGNNHFLQQSFGVPVACHEDAITILADPHMLRLSLYQKIIWGIPPPSQATDIGEKLETKDYHFEVIHTPGHSPDHICLYEPHRRLLFSGDAYVRGKDRVIREGFDMIGIMDSLKKLSDLPIQIIFSGSGSVYEGGSERIREKLLYLEDLRRKIVELDGEGKSEGEIARIIFGREPLFYYVTQGKFSSKRLVTSMLQGSPTQSSLKPLREPMQ